MKKWLSKLLFKLYGWKLVGKVPKDVKKFVLIAAPHTSNMDFFLAMPTMWSLGVPGKFLIKREHTDAFYGPLIKFMGGIGVDRKNQSTEFVKELNEVVDSVPELAMLFTPEGTRKRVDKWKTGFYRVATAVNIPIVLAYAEYALKEVHIGHVFYPSGEFEKDFEYMENFFKNITAAYPEDYNPKIFKRS
ncbi:MAG: 1-acyl-sn-glycerol-3-phosphate acyltransferase [Salibacteraceae bacterium]